MAPAVLRRCSHGMHRTRPHAQTRRSYTHATNNYCIYLPTCLTLHGRHGRAAVCVLQLGSPLPGSLLTATATATAAATAAAACCAASLWPWRHSTPHQRGRRCSLPALPAAAGAGPACNCLACCRAPQTGQPAKALPPAPPLLMPPPPPLLCSSASAAAAAASSATTCVVMLRAAAAAAACSGQPSAAQTRQAGC